MSSLTIAGVTLLQHVDFSRQKSHLDQIYVLNLIYRNFSAALLFRDDRLPRRCHDDTQTIFDGDWVQGRRSECAHYTGEESLWTHWHGTGEPGRQHEWAGHQSG